MIKRWVLAALVVLTMAACNNDDDSKAATSTTASSTAATSANCTKDSKMDPYGEGATHLVHTDGPTYDGPLAPHDNPKYSVNPPSGGDHLSVAASAGIYEGSRVPKDGNLVHSLEHGYVIVWFKPSLSDADKAALRGMRGNSEIARDVLIVERSDMPTVVAATAWGQRLLCDGVGVKQLTDFVKDARNKAPEKIPH